MRLNIRSITIKFEVLTHVIKDKKIDILSLTETWHDEGSVAFFQLRRQGFTVVDRPCPRVGSAQSSGLHSNHGGLAIIYSARSPKFWLQINHLWISCYPSLSTCKMHQSIDYLQNWSCAKTVLLWVIWVLEQICNQLLSVIHHWWLQHTFWATWWPQQCNLQRHPVFTESGVDGPTHDLGGTLDVFSQKKKNCHQYFGFSTETQLYQAHVPQ